MFGFGKKDAPADATGLARGMTAFHEIMVRQEGAFVALKRLIESGAVSREDVVKAWKQADKERRRHWKAKKPDVVFLGPLSIETIIDEDDDDE